MAEFTELLALFEEIKGEMPAITSVGRQDDDDLVKFQLVDWRPGDDGGGFSAYAMFYEEFAVVPLGQGGPMATAPALEILVPMGEMKEPDLMLMCSTLDAAHLFRGAGPRWNPNNGMFSASCVVYSDSPDTLPDPTLIRQGVSSAVGLFYQALFNLWSRKILEVGGDSVKPIVEERLAKIVELLGEVPAV